MNPVVTGPRKSSGYWGG